MSRIRLGSDRLSVFSGISAATKSSRASGTSHSTANSSGSSSVHLVDNFQPDKHAQSRLVATLCGLLNYLLEDTDLEVTEHTFIADLQDGMVLGTATGMLTGKMAKLKSEQSKKRWRKNHSRNIEYVDKTFGTALARKYEIDDLVDGNADAVLSYTWDLVETLHIRAHLGPELTTDMDTEWAMAQAFRNRLVAYPSARVRDIKRESWADGLALCALVHSLDPTLIDFAALDKDNHYENVQTALDLLSAHLGVPPLLTSYEITSPDVDNRPLMIYLGFLLNDDENLSDGRQASGSENEPRWLTLRRKTFQRFLDAAIEHKNIQLPGVYSKANDASSASGTGGQTAREAGRRTRKPTDDLLACLKDAYVLIRLFPDEIIQDLRVYAPPVDKKHVKKNVKTLMSLLGERAGAVEARWTKKGQLDEVCVMDTLWLVVHTLHGLDTEVADDLGESTQTLQHKSILSWLNRHLLDMDMNAIHNLDADVRNGLALCAAVHAHVPMAIPLDLMDAEDPSFNVTLAMDVAQEYLGVPRLLDPEDLLQGETAIDRMAIALYFLMIKDVPPEVKDELDESLSSFKHGKHCARVQMQMDVARAKVSFYRDRLTEARSLLAEEEHILTPFRMEALSVSSSTDGDKGKGKASVGTGEEAGEGMGKTIEMANASAQTEVDTSSVCWICNRHESRESVDVILRALAEPNRNRVYMAARAVTTLGPLAGESLSQLSKLLCEERDQRMSLQLIKALASLGKLAVSELVHLAVNDSLDPLPRANAIHGLRLISKSHRDATKPAIKSLTRLCSSPSVLIRIHAVQALVEAAPRDSRTVAALIDCLKDPQAAVRDEAATALGTIGSPRASVAIEPLIESLALNDMHFRVEVHSKQTLALSKFGMDALPMLMETLQFDLPSVRAQAAAAIGLMHDNARMAVSALTALLQDPSVIVRLHALVAISSIDDTFARLDRTGSAEAAASINSLAMTQLLNHTNVHVRAAAKTVLERAGADVTASSRRDNDSLGHGSFASKLRRTDSTGTAGKDAGSDNNGASDSQPKGKGKGKGKLLASLEAAVSASEDGTGGRSQVSEQKNVETTANESQVDPYGRSSTWATPDGSGETSGPRTPRPAMFKRTRMLSTSSRTVSADGHRERQDSGFILGDRSLLTLVSVREAETNELDSQIELMSKQLESLNKTLQTKETLVNATDTLPPRVCELHQRSMFGLLEDVLAKEEQLERVLVSKHSSLQEMAQLKENSGHDLLRMAKLPEGDAKAVATQMKELKNQTEHRQYELGTELVDAQHEQVNLTRSGVAMLGESVRMRLNGMKAMCKQEATMKKRAEHTQQLLHLVKEKSAQMELRGTPAAKMLSIVQQRTALEGKLENLSEALRQIDVAVTERYLDCVKQLQGNLDACREANELIKDHRANIAALDMEEGDNVVVDGEEEEEEDGEEDGEEVEEGGTKPQGAPRAAGPLITLVVSKEEAQMTKGMRMTSENKRMLLNAMEELYAVVQATEQTRVMELADLHRDVAQRLERAKEQWQYRRIELRVLYQQLVERVQAMQAGLDQEGKESTQGEDVGSVLAKASAKLQKDLRVQKVQQEADNTRRKVLEAQDRVRTCELEAAEQYEKAAAFRIQLATQLRNGVTTAGGQAEEGVQEEKEGGAGEDTSSEAAGTEGPSTDTDTWARRDKLEERLEMQYLLEVEEAMSQHEEAIEAAVGKEHVRVMDEAAQELVKSAYIRAQIAEAMEEEMEGRERTEARERALCAMYKSTAHALAELGKMRCAQHESLYDELMQCERWLFVGGVHTLRWVNRLTRDHTPDTAAVEFDFLQAVMGQVTERRSKLDAKLASVQADMNGSLDAACEFQRKYADAMHTLARRVKRKHARAEADLLAQQKEVSFEEASDLQDQLIALGKEHDDLEEEVVGARDDYFAMVDQCVTLGRTVSELHSNLGERMMEEGKKLAAEVVAQTEVLEGTRMSTLHETMLMECMQHVLGMESRACYCMGQAAETMDVSAEVVNNVLSSLAQHTLYQGDTAKVHAMGELARLLNDRASGMRTRSLRWVSLSKAAHEARKKLLDDVVTHEQRSAAEKAQKEQEMSKEEKAKAVLSERMRNMVRRSGAMREAQTLDEMENAAARHAVHATERLKSLNNKLTANLMAGQLEGQMQGMGQGNGREDDGDTAVAHVPVIAEELSQVLSELVNQQEELGKLASQLSTPNSGDVMSPYAIREMRRGSTGTSALQSRRASPPLKSLNHLVGLRSSEAASATNSRRGSTQLGSSPMMLSLNKPRMSRRPSFGVSISDLHVIKESAEDSDDDEPQEGESQGEDVQEKDRNDEEEEKEEEEEEEEEEDGDGGAEKRNAVEAQVIVPTMVAGPKIMVEAASSRTHTPQSATSSSKALMVGEEVALETQREETAGEALRMAREESEWLEKEAQQLARAMMRQVELLKGQLEEAELLDEELQETMSSFATDAFVQETFAWRRSLQTSINSSAQGVQNKLDAACGKLDEAVEQLVAMSTSMANAVSSSELQTCLDIAETWQKTSEEWQDAAKQVLESRRRSTLAFFKLKRHAKTE